jgi:hypothetical protein
VKRLAILAFIFCIATTAFAGFLDEVKTIPDDAFPSFNYDGVLERLSIKLFFDADDSKGMDAYMKDLQRADFKDISINKDLGVVYQKGSAKVVISGGYSEATGGHLYTMVFSLDKIGRKASDPVVMDSFPALKLDTYFYEFAISVTYIASVPQAVIDEYIEDLEVAGFKYENGSYQLSAIDEESGYEYGSYSFKIGKNGKEFLGSFSSPVN